MFVEGGVMSISAERDESLASRLEEVSKVAWQISLASNLDKAIQAIADNAKKLAKADSCIIYLQRLNGSGEKFEKPASSPEEQYPKFEMAASSPEEQYPRKLRFPGGLTEKIIKDNFPIIISNAREQELGQQVKVKEEILETGIRSIVGVPIPGSGRRAVGAIYVNSKEVGSFSNDDVRVLQALANLIPVAQSLSRPLIKLIEEAETAAEKMFEVENTAQNLCEAIQEIFGFDFVALQVIDHAERSISTIYGTGVAAEWKLANHPLDRGKECDIQADIANAKPPRIEMIRGWDDRFDKWIYERFNHKNMSRVWEPIMVLKDKDGNAITEWFDSSAWGTVNNGSGGKNKIIFKPAYVESRFGQFSIEIIGTIEAGYKTPTDIPPDTAIKLINYVSKAAVCPTNRQKNSDETIRIHPLREVLLPYVLEVITKNAMKIVGGNIGRLYFGRKADGQYLYEVYAADSDFSEPRTLKPRSGGLGEMALLAGRTLVEPDVLQEDTYNKLETSHPEAWRLGIKAMAAFPMFVEPKETSLQGVVYVGLKDRSWFRENEIRSVERFVGRAVDAIRKALMFRQRIDGVRRLENFNRATQSLVDDPQQGGALEWIVGSARNILRADLVTIYEYNDETKKFTNSWYAGRLRNEEAFGYYKSSEIQNLGQWIFETGVNNIFEEKFSQDGEIETGNRYFPDAEKNFIFKEGIRVRFGINLTISTDAANQAVGYMFVYYRDLSQLSENDKKAFQILSYTAAVAIRSKRYLENIRSNLSRREKELEALRDIDKEIVSTEGDVKRIQKLVLDKAMAITGAETGVFLQYDEWESRFKPVPTRSYPEGIEPPSQRMDEGIVGLAALQGSPLVVPDVCLPEWENFYLKVVPSTRSELAFPICDKGKVIALINLEHSEPNSFQQEHADLLAMLAVQALIGIHYGELLASNRMTIRALETLGMIAARAQSAYDQDTILRLFLTGVTAYEGLRFSRAMVFLEGEEGDALEGVMGIGDLEKMKAEQTWEKLEKERETLRKNGKDALDIYLDHDEELSAAIKAGAEAPPSFTQAIKKQRILLSNHGGALVDCLQKRQCRVVNHDEEDRFREILAAISNGTDRGSAFICVPIAFREKVLGVMVADNRFLPSEQQTNFDESVLQTYANILAISLENERLRQSAGFHEVFSEIGHDFNRPVTRLASLMSTLNHAINKWPHMENIFWNSPAGDCFKQMVVAKENLTKFTRDFQEFGEPIYPNRNRIEFGEFIQQQISEFSVDCEYQIDYNNQCPDALIVDVDQDLLGRAIDALLNNAKQAILENIVSDPRITVTTKVETNPGGWPFAVISITDNGPGVPQEKKKIIFRPFFTTRTNQGGSGLGLASARRYVEAHGGTLREVGKFVEGAIFVISLPLPPRALASAQEL